MDYEALLDEAYEEGLVVKEKPLQYNNGRIKGNRIAIRQDIETTIEKADVLAEELGHHFTSVGNILDLSEPQNRKQERQARIWAYNKRVGLEGLINAYEHGCKSKYEVAEFLEVTEELLTDAIYYYRERYGMYTSVKNYTIYFIPHLMVLKKI